MAENRTCSRTSCNEPAGASLSFRYETRQVWVTSLLGHAPGTRYDLCTRHADSVTVPRGWHRLEERREVLAANARAEAAADALVEALAAETVPGPASSDAEQPAARQPVSVQSPAADRGMAVHQVEVEGEVEGGQGRAQARRPRRGSGATAASASAAIPARPPAAAEAEPPRAPGIGRRAPGTTGGSTATPAAGIPAEPAVSAKDGPAVAAGDGGGRAAAARDRLAAPVAADDRASDPAPADPAAVGPGPAADRPSPARGADRYARLLSELPRLAAQVPAGAKGATRESQSEHVSTEGRPARGRRRPRATSSGDPAVADPEAAGQLAIPVTERTTPDAVVVSLAELAGARRRTVRETLRR